MGYAIISPWLIGFLLFTAFPMIFSLSGRHELGFAGHAALDRTGQRPDPR
jgi:hypothetical protein